MSTNNPYVAPRADLAEPNSENIEASRSRRLVAALIDTIINASIIVPLMWFGGAFDHLDEGGELPFLDTLGYGMLGFAVTFALNAYFLKRDGQTIGKKCVGIRITDLEGRKAPLANIIFLRYLPVSIVSIIPHVGQLLALIDVLPIFGKNRRCLHDRIAGTRVLNVKR